jgi:predicted outer membrane protein
MSKANWKTRAVTAAVMTGLMGFSAHANDEDKQQKQEMKQGKAVGEAAAKRVQYVGKLAVFNNRQIKLARLAEQQATDPQVKEFATRLREDHENSQKQLRTWAEQKQMQISALSDSEVTSEDQMGTGGSGVQQGYQEKMKGTGEKLGKALDKSNEEITKLQQKEGPEFDKAFLSRIAEDQKKGKDVLKEGRKEYKNDASFLALLSDTESVVARNETKAKDLEKQMKKQ